MVKLLMLICIFSMSSYASHYYKVQSYPTYEQAIKLSVKSQSSVLDICCHYPTDSQTQALRLTNAQKIIIRAGAFPSAEELKRVEAIGITYELILSEAFPSDQNIKLLNDAQIKKLTITSKDFPYLGEALAINKFKIPIRFDILKRELPTIEHMVVIRKFTSKVNVAFHNSKVPGPGHADFFNSMKASKTFVVHEQFPYGIDAMGLKDFSRSRVEITPDERLMPQDIPVLNQFTHKVNLELTEIWPLTSDLIRLVNQIEVEKIILQDDGVETLLKLNSAATFGMSKSKIIYKFNKF